MFSMGIMEMKVEIVDSIGPGKTHNARGSVGAKYDINKLTVQAPNYGHIRVVNLAHLRCQIKIPQLSHISQVISHFTHECLPGRCR